VCVCVYTQTAGGVLDDQTLKGRDETLGEPEKLETRWTKFRNHLARVMRMIVFIQVL